MNEQSKDSAKTRQRLEKFSGHSKWLVASAHKQKREVSKPLAANLHTQRTIKKFCQFIKGVKLPDGFGSNFKHKVTDNDTNITGLKSHDCHIMMQRLLPSDSCNTCHQDVCKTTNEHHVYSLSKLLSNFVGGCHVKKLRARSEIDYVPGQVKSEFPDNDMKEAFPG
ncbi:hypothetical protein Tco_1008834 [Tanacetum coccineum]